MSGLERGYFLKESIRFLTLTSKFECREKVQKAFRAFVLRVRRKYGKFEYIQVKEKTKKGYFHIHVLYRGSFMFQAYVSRIWAEISSFPIVFIEGVRWNKGFLAGYLAKYLSSEVLRYGWSWEWVFRKFVHVWKRLFVKYDGSSMNKILGVWRMILQNYSSIFLNQLNL